MSDQDIFSNEQKTDIQPSGANDLLASIKNEVGEPKYKTLDEAIKALAHSQAFIPQLLNEKRSAEEELAQLREQVSKSKSVEDVLKELTAKNVEDKPRIETPPVGVPNEDAIAELVKKQLEKEKIHDQEVKNASEVQNALILKFGEKTPDVITAKAAELGTTAKELGDLAKKNPKMVLSLFSASKPSVTPTTSSIHLPVNVQQPALEAPSKSLLLGATSKEQKDYLQKVKEDVYKKYNIDI